MRTDGKKQKQKQKLGNRIGLEKILNIVISFVSCSILSWIDTCFRLSVSKRTYLSHYIVIESFDVRCSIKNFFYIRSNNKFYFSCSHKEYVHIVIQFFSLRICLSSIFYVTYYCMNRKKNFYQKYHLYIEL